MWDMVKIHDKTLRTVKVEFKKEVKKHFIPKILACFDSKKNQL